MRALVTGVAGFIGSHLAEALLDDGDDVIGVDTLTPYYDPRVKRGNLREIWGRPGFAFVERDLLSAELPPLLDGCDVVYHLAGQPGVRNSWADGFQEYVENNVVATQRMLEACRDTEVARFVYASSSSVYGQAPEYPTRETDPTTPFSPYGVTKLGGEHLCGLYAANYGVPTTMLRYFTVYGPRQRPDMGIHRFVHRALTGERLTIFGSGHQVRDFTFVSDVVGATRAAGAAHDVPPGTVINVAGGSSVTVNELLTLIAEEIDQDLIVRRQAPQAGDVEVTGGSISRARQLLSWVPQVDLRSGVGEQVAWHRAQAATEDLIDLNTPMASARQ